MNRSSTDSAVSPDVRQGSHSRSGLAQYQAKAASPATLFAAGSALIAGVAAVFAAAGGAGRALEVAALGSACVVAYCVRGAAGRLTAAASPAALVVLEERYGRLGDGAWDVVALALVYAAAPLLCSLLRERVEERLEAPPEPDVVGLLPFRAEAETRTVEGALSRLSAAHESLTVLLLRPDRLDELVARHGEDASRAVLERVAAVLSEHVRSTDVLIRQGRFDFWLVLPGTPPERARRTAERIRLEIGSAELALATGAAIAATVSVGLASVPEDGRAPADVAGAAERALEAAVAASGNRTVLHSVPPGAPAGWGVATAAPALRHAV